MATDSSTVVYTGISTPNIPMVAGLNLQTILQRIDTSINTHNAAPDYTGYYLGPYNGYSIVQTDGTSHPTNTQNFAEGISKILCILESDYNTFTGTTYVSDQATLTNAISAIQVPGLTYSYSGGGGSISIGDTDSLNTVLTKTYTGVGSILALLNAPGNTWSSISLGNPNNINTAFNNLINVIGGINTTISGLQTSLGTINNTGNCLINVGGGATDGIVTTIGYITEMLCSLPTLSPGGYTWGCVSSSSTLDGILQNVITEVSYIGNNFLATASTGLTTSENAGCSGYNVAINPSWTGLFKVAASAGDSNGDYLSNKIFSSGGSITIDYTTDPTKLNIEVTNPNNNYAAVSSIDAHPGYLLGKISSLAGNWGIANQISANANNSQLNITPTVVNPELLVQSILQTISSDPNLLALFCSLQTQCAGCSCSAPIALSISINNETDVYTLSWTIGGSPTAQMVKYRQRGSTVWIENANIRPVNPVSYEAVTATVSNLNENTVYQFQVDSICSGTANGSSIVESIIFNCQTVTSTVTGGVISVNQAPLLTVDTIQYTLYNGSTALQTIVANGTNPVAVFDSVGDGSYTVQYRYAATVNGITVYSTDSSQLNEYCVTGTITVSA